jgi:hypothetical protein
MESHHEATRPLPDRRAPLRVNCRREIRFRRSRREEEEQASRGRREKRREETESAPVRS